MNQPPKTLNWFIFFLTYPFITHRTIFYVIAIWVTSYFDIANIELFMAIKIQCICILKQNSLNFLYANLRHFRLCQEASLDAIYNIIKSYVRYVYLKASWYVMKYLPIKSYTKIKSFHLRIQYTMNVTLMSQLNF